MARQAIFCSPRCSSLHKRGIPAEAAHGDGKNNANARDAVQSTRPQWQAGGMRGRRKGLVRGVVVNGSWVLRASLHWPSTRRAREPFVACWAAPLIQFTPLSWPASLPAFIALAVVVVVVAVHSTTTTTQCCCCSSNSSSSPLAIPPEARYLASCVVAAPPLLCSALLCHCCHCHCYCSAQLARSATHPIHTHTQRP